MPDDSVVPRLKRLADLLRPTLGERARGIVATFERSVSGLSAEAREALLLASLCLAGEPIPRALIEESLLALDVAPWPDTHAIAAQRVPFARGAPGILDPVECGDRTAVALRELFGASLLLARQGSDAPQLHALLGQAMGSLLPEAAQRTPALRHALVQTLTRRLDAADDIRAHAALLAELPHARHAFESDDGVDTIRLGWRLALYEMARGDYRPATTLGEITLGRARALLGNEHLDTLISITNLAAALMHAGGQDDRALALLIEERAACLRTLGRDHTESLTANSNLANAYRAQGHLLRARRLDALTLGIRRRVLGNFDPKTLTSINNLGVDYRHVEDPSRAERLFVEAIAGRSRVLGSDHADTLVSRGNLLSAIDMAGRHQEAALMGEELLATFRRINGDSHPETLTTLHNVARVMFKAGRTARALELIDEAARGRKWRLGATHRETMDSERVAALMREHSSRRST